MYVVYEKIDELKIYAREPLEHRQELWQWTTMKSMAWKFRKRKEAEKFIKYYPNKSLKLYIEK